jgi:Homeodomain-like domain
MAEFERDMLRQRTNAGLIAARKRGRFGGRSKSIDTAAIKKARVMLASGDYTKAEVAAELGVSRHTLWRELAREAANSLPSGQNHLAGERNSALGLQTFQSLNDGSEQCSNTRGGSHGHRPPKQHTHATCRASAVSRPRPT